VVQRFIDALQAFPPLVLALVMVATMGASLGNVILAIAVTGIAGKARVVRGTSLSLMQNPYVEAARTLGSGHLRVMVRHILPNAWAPVIVVASNSLGTAIVAEASLSFLGLGPPPPTPTWGGMLSGNARNYMQIAPWLALAPGVAITAIVIAFNLLGDGLRDILDPRLRGTR
jgi:peptide/nickel transport system permease protein